MTDFRALCAELLLCMDQDAALVALRKTAKGEPLDGPWRETIRERARVALAQPEPQGPTDEEILALSQWHEVSYTLCDGGVIYPLQQGSDMKDAVLSFTRAVLQRWGRPAIEPQQEADLD